MLTRSQKEALVLEVTEKIKESKSLVFVDFQGLSVTDTQLVKKELRVAGVQYKVLKKRLFALAAQNAGVEMDASKLSGQFAVAFSMEDEIAGAKILHNFMKTHESMLLNGGVLEGKELSSEEVISLAKMPSKQELLAKVVGSMNAPLSGLVQVLSGNTRGLVVALKAIADQK